MVDEGATLMHVRLNGKLERAGTTEKEMEQPNIELKPCPFCGNAHAPMFWNTEEMYDDPELYEQSGSSEGFAVVCDASNPDGRGGCGASGGFKQTIEEAAANWNKRTPNPEVTGHPPEA